MQEIQELKIGNLPVLNGLTEEEIAESSARLTAKIQAESGRLRGIYGEISDYEISQIIRAEKEIAACKNCSGFPCKKVKRQNTTPKIIYNSEYREIIVMEADCKYEKARRAQLTLKRRYGLSKIPPEYSGKTFADYKVDANNSYAVEVAKALIDRPNNGAYFFGSVGTGKTLLAAITAQEIIRRGRQAIFATIPTISMQLRSTFNTNAPISETEILEKLTTVPTLILDDVGVEKATRFVCSTLANIFNERYNARLQTIMTSNYRLKELEKIFNNPTDSKEPTLDGTRIYDRCKQMCTPVEFKGKSRRL